MKWLLYIIKAGTLCIIVLLQATTSRAQEKIKISGSYTTVPFKQWVQAIESTTPYYFYYDDKAMDTFYITLQAKELGLAEILQKAFDKTALHFHIDTANQVFISTKLPVQTRLPAHFFDKTKRFNDSLPALAFDLQEAAVAQSLDNRRLEIGNRSNPLKGKANISGYIRHAASGEAIGGATVYIDSLSISTLSNPFGYYIITAPTGTHTLRLSSVGMQDAAYPLQLFNDGKLDLQMQDYIPSLKTVVVISDRNTNTKSLTMGLNRLQMQAMKKVPVVFGETDILRVVQTLPGVTSAGEASTGFHVRGGASDQNLILFSDATIYNPTHLFGFFSAFNPDVVKGVDLYKSGIPQKFGGRLSSVMEVTPKEGNGTKLSGAGGIGLLTSRLMLEGPLAKGKTTFVAGGRMTYSNWLLKKVTNNNYKNSLASFYDGNLHVSHTINTKNNLYLTGYISHDKFRLNRDTLFQYGNTNFNLKWKHIYNKRLTGVTTIGMDVYQYALSSEQNPVNAFDLSYKIQQFHFRSDFNYTVNNKHQLNFGVHSIYYKLQPGIYKPKGTQSLVEQDVLQSEKALESALYLGDAFTITPKLSVNAGLRISLFNYLGPRSVYQYLKDMPRQEATITDTSFYGSGKVIQSYRGPEYRMSARYTIGNNASFKISFNTLRQYIHMLTNTNAISPTDTWKLSDQNIKPQQGYQVAVGYYKNFKSNTIETSVELYYKKLKHYLDYKSGAQLMMNHHIETDVLATMGKAYGAELFIKKETGKFNGWFSYTYSRTWLKGDDPLAGELVNNGAFYPANHDKPHNLNVITNFRFSHRFSISVTTAYSTGRPVTLPLAIFNQGGAQRLYYSQRNEYRIPDYFRTDLSLMLEGNHKIKKLAHSSWSLGVYNLTGRQNAYAVYFVQENGRIKGYQLSIFGIPIPFITYNFKF